MPAYRSKTSTAGRNMAGARALWRATGMKDDDFKAARERTFHDACVVWNAVDTSSKTRIRVPEPPLGPQMAPVLQNTAMSHTDSDAE